MEIERARLTRQLACMKEEEGELQEAAEILQEVAVVSGAAARGPRSGGLCHGREGGLQEAAVVSGAAAALVHEWRRGWRARSRRDSLPASLTLPARPPTLLRACPPARPPARPQETFGAMAKTEKIAYILEQV